MNMNDYFVVSEFLIRESTGLYKDYFSIFDEQEKTKIFDKLVLINGLKLKAGKQLIK